MKQKYLRYIKLCAEGKSETQIAEEMGVSRRTLYNWRQKLKSPYDDQYVYYDMMRTVTNNIHSSQERYLDKIIEGLATEGKSADLETLYTMSANMSVYTRSVANVCKQLGVNKFQSLMREVDEKEKRIKELEQLLLKYSANNEALEHGECIPFPEAEKEFAKL
jgi:transcriptional regulator with XRE-family HTH domain